MTDAPDCQQPSYLELIRDEGGNQAWAKPGCRFLVMVRHTQARPLHVFSAMTEEIARAMVERAAALHAADNDLCQVHYWQPATVIGTVPDPSGDSDKSAFGPAGGHKRRLRFDRDCAVVEGINPDDHAAMRARRESARAQMLDDIMLYSRLNGLASSADRRQIDEGLA